MIAPDWQAVVNIRLYVRFIKMGSSLYVLEYYIIIIATIYTMYIE